MAKKVLLIHNRIHLGGPIYIVAYLSKYLSPEFDIKLLIGPLHEEELSAEKLLDDLGVRYSVLTDMRRSINPFLDIKSFFQVRRIIKDFKPDIVHTHTAKAGTIGRLAAWVSGVPVIIHTFHGHLFHSYFSPFVTWIYKQVERFLAGKTDAIIAISEIQKRELGYTYKIANPTKIHVIPLGLDLEKFAADAPAKRASFRKHYQIPETVTAFALIGRFAPVKNHYLLFDTLQLLREQYPEKFNKLVVFLVGDGKMKAKFKAKLLASGIPVSETNGQLQRGGVIMTSWITEISDIISGFDAVVLTSLNEGTPLSLIESQAAAVPVISTRVGGVEDVVLEGKTGIITPSGDKQALAQAFIQFVDRPAERKEMGMAGKTWIQSKFSYKRLVADTRDLYLMLLNHEDLIANSFPGEREYK